MDFNAFMKNISGGGGGTGEKEMDVDDELEALEAEVNGEKKKNKAKGAGKKKNDDSLSDLSDGDNGDNNADKGKSVPQQQQFQQPYNPQPQQFQQPRPQPQQFQQVYNPQQQQYSPQQPYNPQQQQYSPQQQQYNPNQQQQQQQQHYSQQQNPQAMQYQQQQQQRMPQHQLPNNNPQISQNKIGNMIDNKPLTGPTRVEPVNPKLNVLDIYNPGSEKVYHNYVKMESVSVLQNELELCEKIIQFKKGNGIPFDIWEGKKAPINSTIIKITNAIEIGELDLEKYKVTIQRELAYEKKLLGFLPKDTKIQKHEADEIKRRLDQRIKLIEDELTEEIEEETPTEPQKIEPKKEETKPVDKVKEVPIVVPVVVPTVVPVVKEVPKVIEKSKEEPKKEVKPKEEPKKEVKAKEEPKEEEPKEEEEKLKPKGKVKEKPKEEEKPKEVPKVIKEKTKEELKEEARMKEEQKKKAKTDLILKLVQDRSNEYKRALDYFKDNGCDSQIEDAVDKCKILQKAEKYIEDGKFSKVNDALLPEHITPEYIYGYSTEERTKKFKAIFADYTGKISDITQRNNDICDKLKTVKKTDLKKVSEMAKKELDDLKKRKEKLENLMNQFKEFYKDEWRPAPLYSAVEEEEKTEIINTDIPPTGVMVCLGKTDYQKENLHAVIILEGTKVEVAPKSQADFGTSSMLILDKGDYKSLYKKTLDIEIYRKHWYKEELKGKGLVKLTELKSQSELKKSCDITLESQRCVPKIEVMIQVRTPLVDKEYEIKMKKITKVTKIMPSFDIKGSLPKSVIKEEPKSQIQSTPVQPKPKPVAKAQVEVGVIEEPKSNTPKERIDKSKFSEAELANPDVLDNLNTMEVLTFKEQELDQKIQKIEGRTPKNLREQLVKIRFKKKILEEQLGEEALKAEAYVDIIKNQHQHDKVLYDYFEQENDKEKAAMVAPRLKLLLKEMNDTLQYLKESGKK